MEKQVAKIVFLPSTLAVYMIDEGIKEILECDILAKVLGSLIPFEDFRSLKTCIFFEKEEEKWPDEEKDKVLEALEDYIDLGTEIIELDIVFEESS